MIQDILNLLYKYIYLNFLHNNNKMNIFDNSLYHFQIKDNYEIFNEVISQTRNELLNNFDASVVNGGIINENGDNITIGRTQKENINSDDLYFNFHIQVNAKKD